jgi:sigma-B regulation protein RsbU (phosphoserine phosphatase)
LLLRHDDHQVTWLSGRGMALGVQATVELEEHAIQLESGDVLVMYTDGVTEATNAELEFFGRERLQAAVLSVHHDNAEAVLKQILDAIRDFVGRYEQHDDLTIVVLRCK